MSRIPATLFSLTAMVAFGLCGCASEGDDPTSTVTSPPPDTVPDKRAHGHAHPTEGPHHGELIELGNEEYHAELLHPHHHDDDAHPHEGGAHQNGDHHHAGVTIYILDGSAKNVVPIEAQDVTINVSHDGKPEQFKLPAMPTETDPDGKSSRFASADRDLLEHFHEEEIEGTLVLTINGKSYRGKIAHSHDHAHEGHGHDGHDHEAETD